MKRPDPIVIGIAVLTVVVVGGIFYAASRTEKTNIEQYQQGSAERPRLEISQSSFDFGRVTLTDKKKQDVSITNTGTKPLVISGLLTSCNCTFAQLVMDGEASPKFSTTWLTSSLLPFGVNMG